MSVTIGINGFGRIGRSLPRIVHAMPNPGITIAAVNDLATADKLAYGLRRDSIRGSFPGTVVTRTDQLVVNDRAIRVFCQPEPGRVPWADAGVDVVNQWLAGTRPNNGMVIANPGSLDALWFWSSESASPTRLTRSSDTSIGRSLSRKACR